jgi:hypothetical protein
MNNSHGFEQITEEGLPEGGLDCYEECQREKCRKKNAKADWQPDLQIEPFLYSPSLLSTYGVNPPTTPALLSIILRYAQIMFPIMIYFRLL